MVLFDSKVHVLSNIAHACGYFIKFLLLVVFLSKGFLEMGLIKGKMLQILNEFFGSMDMELSINNEDYRTPNYWPVSRFFLSSKAVK